jgi:PAS domain S-box-containing protein
MRRAPGHDHSRSQSSYFRLLVENTLDLVIVLQADGTVLYSNPTISRVLGHKDGASNGKSIFAFVHPDDLGTVKRALDETIENPANVCQIEFRLRHDDGSWRDIEAFCKSLLHNPEIASIVLTARDVTAHKEAEKALRESEAALRESHKQLAAVTARLLKVEEEELKRIAREVHDDLTQQLALTSLEVDDLTRNLPRNREEVCRRLKRVQAQLARIADDLHRMAHQLHPSMLEDLGLVPALRSYCMELSQREGITISFEHQGVWEKLPGEVVLCIYRVAQEALRNVLKHSEAKKAEVSLMRVPGSVRLRIHDFGKGFIKETKKRGLGLLSMEERVRLAGGVFSLHSIPRDGTTVEAAFPIQG